MRANRNDQATFPAPDMGALRLVPRIDRNGDRLYGSTPWIAQVLCLFAYCHCVTIDRHRQSVMVSTRWLWFWQRVHRIQFDQVSRIVYRAQVMPSLMPWRYLYFQSAPSSDWAFFLISLAVKKDSSRAVTELPLFTVWEQQPREPSWVDNFAGIRRDASLQGDESSRALVDILRGFLGVPIATH